MEPFVSRAGAVGNRHPVLFDCDLADLIRSHAVIEGKQTHSFYVLCLLSKVRKTIDNNVTLEKGSSIAWAMAHDAVPSSVAPLEVMDAPKEAADTLSRRSSFGTRRVERDGASDVAREARLLSQLLQLFSHKRHVRDGDDDHYDDVDSAVDALASATRSLFSLEDAEPRTSRSPLFRAASSPSSVLPFRLSSSSNDERVATALLRTRPSERELVQQFLLLPTASQQKVAQSLFVIPPSLIDNFASVLQFFVRVLIEAHSNSAVHQYQDAVDATTALEAGEDLAVLQEKTCSWARTGQVSCVEIHDVEETTDNATAGTARVEITLPEGFHECLVAIYGSVERNKCEEVWHGDHMAYRCRTCGLSDSSCMCLACFDPADHEGHDYRVYRCSSGGCCDCGDPLAWRPEGFCKKHRAAMADDADDDDRILMSELEHTVVRGLIRRVLAFCANVMREVYLYCLRSSSSDVAVATNLRELPRTGRRRTSFPSIIQVHLERVEQSLAWLQTIATSCLQYRQALTELLFEALPPDFHLDPPSTADDSSSEVMPPLLVLDVFLKAGVLLPVEICDTLGVLYLKLLFEHGFKERYTGHFVDWYPYFIALYLQSSEENNEEGMRNLSRFIDRLFCQLFHSTAQLDALEAKFEARRIRLQQIQDEQEKVTEGVVTQSLLAFRRYGALRAPVDRTSSLTCVEWLMMFLLERLHSLFESALRVESVKCRSMTSSSTGSAENTYYESSLLLPIQVVDCGRSVFRKRVYARLCSDLRTLLVHPRVAADVLLRSFEPVDAPTQPLEVREHSVYQLLLRSFEVLQQMDLQQRHVHQHIEFESQSWTFAFVVDYEMNLLLNAFVGGIPLCFEKDVFHHTMKTEMDDQNDVDRWWLARGMLQPLEDMLLTWTARVNGHPDDLSGKNLDAVRLYERSVMTTEGPMKKSFHLPLHHMLATFIQGVASVVQPQTVAHWQRLLLPSQEATDLLRLAYALVDHPLRVSMFTREIKSGLWVRNGNAMWQQLVHYDAKHWRATGLHNDLFLTQLGALLLSANGPGQLTRFLLTQFPVRNARVLALTVQGDDLYDDEGCTLGQQMELLEETLRLVMQLVQSPVRLALCAEPVESATFLLEREMMHWLSLGPLTRSEVLVHLDMKLVEHVRQLDAHPWHLLEEEEIVTQVLERVGEYDDPTGGPNAANATMMSFGMKMSGTWKLQCDLWTDISPLFEGFSPAEAQQCEQNVKKQLQLISSREQQKDSAIDTKSLALPLPRSIFQAPMAKTLASQLLNAPSLLAVLWIVLQNHHAQGSDGGKKKVDDDDEDDDDTPRVTTENLVVAALSCLYIGVNLIEDASPTEETDEMTKDNGLPRPMAEWERVEQVMEASTAFLSRLCVEIETRDGTKVSVLSMLNEWIAKPSALSGDTITLCREIIRVAEEKSEDCRVHVATWRQQKADEAAKAAIASAASSSSTASDATDRQQQAKEMMRRRQQAILERMRSQQQQFLSSQSLDNGDLANESESKEGKDDEEGMDDDDDDDDTGDVTDHDDDDEEDDEWGFPTGQLDLQLYLGHLSSAIALACERDRREQQRKRRLQQRKRRVPRTTSGGSESNGSLWSRSSSSSVEMESGEDEESDDASPECALCRLACEPNTHEATYGYVSMIQPTCLPTKAGLTSSSLLQLRDNVHTMGDAVIWTCGHVVHHSCIKSYIESLWKQRNSNRNPLEALHAHGDDRVLSEREREFLCPVCRRLSNCLVPHVDGSAAESTVIEQTSVSDSISSSFLRWLKTEMRVGGLRDRRRRGTLDMLLQDQIKRRICRFVRDIRLRSVRASLQLPLLLADGAEDEASSETEMQRVVDEWSASSASYEVLLRSFEVEVDVAIHERVLLCASTLERHRFQSLRILADVVVSAAAVIDVDEAKKPKLSDASEVVTNVLFGRRVLFAEDDDDRRRSRFDVPLLSSSRLFAVFLTRLTFLLAQSPTTEARYDETIISEVYYLARILVAAQILQTLCQFRRLDQAHAGDESVASPRPPRAKRDAVISDFGDVETLVDAEEWTAQLMMRSRFLASTATLRHASTNQLETFIAKQCLPLLRRLVLTLEVFFPRVVNHDVAHATSDEPCAVCDEIFSTVAVKSTPTPEHTEMLHHLRRLHLPPLRVFFSRHVFAPSQRELCQLWAAQVESSAAVRRQRQLPGPYSLGIFTSDVPVEDVTGAETRARSLIIDLPRVYMELFIKYNDKPSGCCQRCNQIPQHPAICLFCGDVLCCFSTCCESPRGRIGECTQHAQSCGLGTGAFLLLRACTVILFLGNERRCVWGSLYVDKNGEEDPYLRRGKTLFLAPSRLQALETLLLSHSFTQNTAILANTSRRDGRRY